MGTRADFYVGRGKAAEWIGSVAWDGYPFDGAGVPLKILKSKTEAAYRAAVKEFLSKREDATKVTDGWPWPWEDSRGTDYAYAFDGKRVHASNYGGAWFDPTKLQPETRGRGAVFPEMKNRNVTFGPRSGLMIGRRNPSASIVDRWWMR